MRHLLYVFFFFFNDPATPEIYTLSLHDALPILRSLAREKGLAFTATVSPDIPLAQGDGTRITQCLMNLAGNALKFTRRGRVDMDVRLDGEWLVDRVADTGIGIPKDEGENGFAA